MWVEATKGSWEVPINDSLIKGYRDRLTYGSDPAKTVRKHDLFREEARDTLLSCLQNQKLAMWKHLYSAGEGFRV